MTDVTIGFRSFELNWDELIRARNDAKRDRDSKLSGLIEGRTHLSQDYDAFMNATDLLNRYDAFIEANAPDWVKQRYV